MPEDINSQPLDDPAVGHARDPTDCYAEMASQQETRTLGLFKDSSSRAPPIALKMSKGALPWRENRQGDMSSLVDRYLPYSSPDDRLEDAIKSRKDERASKYPDAELQARMHIHRMKSGLEGFRKIPESQQSSTAPWSILDQYSDYQKEAERAMSRAASEYLEWSMNQVFKHSSTSPHSARHQRVIEPSHVRRLGREDPTWTKDIDEVGMNNGLIDCARGHMVVSTKIGPYSGTCSHKGSSKDTRCNRLPRYMAQAVSRDILTRLRSTHDDVDIPQVQNWLDQSLSQIHKGVQSGTFNCRTLREYADKSGIRTGIPMEWQIDEDGTESVILTHLRARDTQNPATDPEIEIRFLADSGPLDGNQDSDEVWPGEVLSFHSE